MILLIFFFLSAFFLLVPRSFFHDLPPLHSPCMQRLDAFSFALIPPRLIFKYTFFSIFFFTHTLLFQSCLSGELLNLLFCGFFLLASDFSIPLFPTPLDKILILSCPTANERTSSCRFYSAFFFPAFPQWSLSPAPLPSCGGLPGGALDSDFSMIPLIRSFSPRSSQSWFQDKPKRTPFSSLDLFFIPPLL